jgi:uncharacterized protein (TIGR04141 family)
VSLYRLDGGLDFADYLVSLTSEEVHVDQMVRVADIDCRFCAGLLRSDQPEWSDHVESLTGIAMDLPGLQPFAVLLIPAGPWTYALAWGAGYHLIDDELIDQGFGLMFGIRRLNSEDLGLIASSALDTSARITQTSFPGGSDLAGFRLEPYGELVTRLVGSADLTGLTYGRDTGKSYRIRVGNALRAPLAREPQALLADLRAVGKVVDESDEHSDLRFIAQIRPLGKHHPKRPELDRRLALALGGDESAGVLGIAWPAGAVRDAEEATSFKIVRCGPGGPMVVDPVIELGELTPRFAELEPDRRLDDLRDARVIACADDLGEQEYGSPISLRKWIVFETSLDHVRYCYQQGNWYRIGEGFVEQIRDQVVTLLNHRSSLSFPLWTPTGKPDDEHRYCEQVAKQHGYLCLDRDFARTPFHPRFELCDVLAARDELVHVKWLGAATAASHLFTQAAVSAEALREEPEAMAELVDKVRERDSRRVVADPSVVVLAIAGREWTVDQLFTLSQVSLLRLDRTLRRVQMKLEFADIPFKPKESRSSTR